MANSFYNFGKESFVGGDLAFDTDNNKIVFVDEADDTIDLALDQDLADRAVASRVAISGNLTSKTITGGTLDAADTTVNSVTGDQFESIDLYKDTGVEATSILILNIDTGTGLPATPGGGNITVQWNAAGIASF